MSNDIQSGDVIINWWVTALIVIGSVAIFGMIALEATPVLSLFIGLLCAGAWLAHELLNWDYSEVDDL